MKPPTRSILVTGAGGYVGRALVRRLGIDRREPPFADSALTVVDLSIPEEQRVPGLRWLEGDLAESQILDASVQDHPDLVFHLAGVTSRRAETDFVAGLHTNVKATMALLERLRLQGSRPSFVFLSSIAVFGAPLPATIDDHTPTVPTLSYGTQKRMMELLVAEYTRRNWIEGLSVRLSSIVARPPSPENALSAFAGAIIRELAEGRRYTCPVNPEATILWQSLPVCIDNLLHAARLLRPQRSGDGHESTTLPPHRALTLPAIRASVSDVITALAGRFGASLHELIDFHPDPALSGQFDRWPPLATLAAERLGFSRDVDLDSLISEAVRII